MNKEGSAMSSSAKISYILNSNDPPNELEARSIYDLMITGLIQRTVLDAQIDSAALLPSQEALIKERDALDCQISEYQACLSIIRHIPTEILSLIFAFAVDIPRDSSSHKQIIWTISHVCARWRTITLSQPALWAVVNIDLSGMGDRSRFRLGTQLRRSGKSPLNITFSCIPPGEPCEEADLLNMLVDHCLRWNTFALSYYREGLHWNIQSIRGRLPVLRELAISEEQRNDIRPLDYFQVAPQLRHASVLMGASLKTVKLPFPQLLRYKGTDNWNGHIAVLRIASNLVDCALDVEYITKTPGPFTRVWLPRLHRLAVTNSKFLDYLEAPGLQEFHFSGPTSAVVSFLQRMPCKLQKIFFHDCHSSNPPPDFPPLLRAAPTITDMGVQFGDGVHARDLFSLLAVPAGGTDCEIPLVESLSICTRRLRYNADLDLTDPFLDMVESRWRTGALRSVSVSSEWRRLLARMETLRDQGLKITHKETYRLLLDMTPPHLRLEYGLRNTAI
ncbi:hypothetical protein DFH07DRAFT_1059309 [Mycena maculata]|uniref:F-box domain-containing protein n=1 Tax=Mycena maculata TaxID=230809 RepID=A0AAD7JJ99_9AGAR|nr:hypothetical protein DFH07DRAFT_1059309 [Mycena maculata]